MLTNMNTDTYDWLWPLDGGDTHIDAPSLRNLPSEGNTTDLPHPYNTTLLFTADAIASGIILGVIILLTLFGNFLVICAVVSFPRLRSTTNMFIVSLAIADITVAVLVMPFALIYGVLEKWIFGWVFCYFWMSCDVMCCTASIMHLCVISLDRYLAITKPLKYKMLMSKRRAILLIVCIWLCGGLVSFLPIYLGWYTDLGDEALYADSPHCGLFVNPIYAVISSSTSFYIPLLVMIITYYKIYKIARSQLREIRKLEICAKDVGGVATDSRLQRKSRRVARDTKAVKTLGTLMGLFIVSWLPFFLMYLIMPFCSNCHLPRRVESLITWLGYVNSLINPCIYAWLNKDFRLAFKRILCGWRASASKTNENNARYLNGNYTPGTDRHNTLGGNGNETQRLKQYSADSDISDNSRDCGAVYDPNTDPVCKDRYNGYLTVPTALCNNDH